MRLRHVGGLILLLAVGGCATGNTLAQDLAWERWQKCNTVPTISLKEIRPDGQIWVLYTDPGPLATWKECDRQAAREQAARRSPAPQVASQAPTAAEDSAVSALPGTGAPIWRRGYEWAFRYEGGGGMGTFVWTVDREQTMDGFDCYVIKGGTREIFYRKTDLAHVNETVSGVPVSHTVPPAEIAWPLVVGKTWQQAYTSENWATKQTTQIVRVVTVEGEEDVTVPAGTFKAFKISVRNKTTGALTYEFWYAPAVMQWIKMRENLASGQREREMIAYKLK